MKHPWIAFVLNFLLPGLGLLYVNRIGLAAINFLVAVLVPTTALLVSGDTAFDYLHYVMLAIAAGSAGLAHAAATRSNAND